MPVWLVYWGYYSCLIPDRSKSTSRPESRDNSLPREPEPVRQYSSVDVEALEKMAIAIIDEYTHNSDPEVRTLLYIWLIVGRNLFNSSARKKHHEELCLRFGVIFEISKYQVVINICILWRLYQYNLDTGIFSFRKQSCVWKRSLILQQSSILFSFLWTG